MSDTELYDVDLRDFDMENEEALLEEMGLTRNDTEKLRDTMLSPEEAIAAKSEELTRIRQFKGRKKNWLEFLDVKARMGNVMHHSEFLRRLRTLVPTLIVADGRVRGTLSLMYVRSTPVKEIPDYPGSFRWHAPAVVYLGWIQEGFSPEYDIDMVDEDGVALGREIGWRTALMSMIIKWHVRLDHNGEPLQDIFGLEQRVARASVITEEQVNDAFGKPTTGPASSIYRMNLINFRNAVPPVKKER